MVFAVISLISAGVARRCDTFSLNIVYSSMMSTNYVNKKVRSL